MSRNKSTYNLKFSSNRKHSSAARETVSSITNETERRGRDSPQTAERLWEVCRTESEGRESTTDLDIERETEYGMHK